jgi:hypothetical protein
LLCVPYRTLHPGGIRTRIICSLGGCDDHCPTQFEFFWAGLLFVFWGTLYICCGTGWIRIKFLEWDHRVDLRNTLRNTSRNENSKHHTWYMLLFHPWQVLSTNYVTRNKQSTLVQRKVLSITLTIINNKVIFMIYYFIKCS